MFGLNPAQLVVDVGNTRYKFAFLEQFWADDELSLNKLPECYGTIAYENDEPICWREIQKLLADPSKQLVRVLISGSHPDRMDDLAAIFPADLPEPRVILYADELPVCLDVQHPETVGLDRILNVMAVNRLRSPAHWAIIVDTGTATTIDVVSCSGAFQGGAILPGYELAAHSLHDYTELLPLISMEEILEEPPDVVGRQTNHAVRSGLFWGQVGAVNEIVSRISEELHQTTQAEGEFYLTGGAAPLLRPHLNRPFRYYPQLTLQGLGSLE